jgi:hypothetical protein
VVDLTNSVAIAIDRLKQAGERPPPATAFSRLSATLLVFHRRR